MLSIYGLEDWLGGGSHPAPNLPPTPTKLAPLQVQSMHRHIQQQFQTHLPGELDCTLNMVDVPSLGLMANCDFGAIFFFGLRRLVLFLMCEAGARESAGGDYRAPCATFRLPAPSRPTDKDRNDDSLGASSAPAPSAAPPTLRAEYQCCRAGIAQSQSESTHRPSLERGYFDHPSQHRPSVDKHAHLPGALTPHATMTRTATYQQPPSPTQQGFQPVFV
ncbi:hypothetical protein DFH08DRAFT_969397 [Mycena albidolilacea]|uniref:Uncharacterized protein n=1 Tax=Mycena albidolilacea TaxID=1033008 RepID=A0AAD7EGL1_9AGAR|nr:hypothetical protein DFH08DRAFT_969397 [Mycena albidolilacea]